MTKGVPEVLFVCVQNAGRSQMAARVVEAMAEVGVDISKEFPKPVTDEAVQAADAVITMGCGDACPIYPGKRYEDWEIDDPADADLEGVRRIRGEISQRVRRLLGELAPEESATG
jgi:arsenate reductase